MIDVLCPPALDRDDKQVPHRFLHTYWRTFIIHHHGNGAILDTITATA